MEGLLLPLLLMLVVAVPLVLGTRKQKRQMQQQQELQKNLVDGDRVMTTSGLYATVADASDETTIDLEIADGLVTTWLRQAVREKVNPSVDVDEDEESAEDATATASSADVDMDKADTEPEKAEAEVASSVEQGKK